MPNLQERLNRLEQSMGSADFWNSQDEARQTVREASALKQRIENWQAINSEQEDADVLFELAEEENDEQVWQEVIQTVQGLIAQIDRLELTSLLAGQYDDANALLTIHPGAGGTESQDWAQMLLRMYSRWAEAQGYDVDTLDFLPGDEAGIKSVTLHLKGQNAFGYLQAEKGVHRLVRISPFDASGRRHTSFASVDVMPEIDELGEIVIDPADLKVDTFRASGAGGQHVNKTDSAVRLTHTPTGIVVSCQSERSQHANREAAMRVMRAKLLERQMEEQEAKLAEIRGEQREIAWGNQIRSYVFCPYTMVKDHRTDFEMSDVEAVMDGELGDLIEAYLHWKVRDRGQVKS